MGRSEGPRGPRLNPAEAPCPGVARRVPFRAAGLGVRAPGPGRDDGLDALRRPPGAGGVAVPSPICNQVGQGRVGPGCPWSGPEGGRSGLPGTRRERDPGAPPGWGSGAEAARLRPRAGSAACFGARPTVLSRRTADRSGSACRRVVAPGRLVTIDRVPLPGLGRPRASSPTRRPEPASSEERMRSHGVAVIGDRPWGNGAQGEIARGPAGAQDVQLGGVGHAPVVQGARGRAGCPLNLDAT